MLGFRVWGLGFPQQFVLVDKQPYSIHVDKQHMPTPQIPCGQQHPGGKAFVNGQSPAFEVAPFSSKWLALAATAPGTTGGASAMLRLQAPQGRVPSAGLQQMDTSKLSESQPLPHAAGAVGDCKQQRVT